MVCFCLCALPPVEVAFQSRAAASFGLDFEFRIDNWQTEHGLPQNSITAIAQTPDGYLWLGTFGGLARFDGVRFEIFNPVHTPELGSGRVTLMSVDRRGWLWIHSEGNHLTKMANGVFETVNGRLGLPLGAIVNFRIDPDGEVWVLPEKSTYYRFATSGFAAVASLEVMPTNVLKSFRLAGSNSAWIATGAGWAMSSHSALILALRASGLNAPQVFPGRNGDMWVLDQARLRKVRNGTISPEFLLFESDASPVDLLEDELGNVWIATWDRGLLRIEPAGAMQQISLGKATGCESVRTLFSDAEGNMWAGTDTGGLVRVAPKAFRNLDESNGLHNKIVKSVFEDSGGRIWALHGVGVDWLDSNGLAPAQLNRSDLWSGAATADGRVWLGTYSGGLLQHENGRFLECAVPPGLTMIRAMAADQAGQMWIGSVGGLGKLDGTNAVQIGLPSQIAEPDVRAIADDWAGGLWVGLNGGGLLRRTGDRWEQFTTEQGLVDNHVYSLCVETNGVVWVGTAFGGLSRFYRGRFFNFNPAEFPLPSGVSGLVADDVGNLWMGSTSGIYRVRLAELEQAAAGGQKRLTVRRYGKPDGLGTSESASSMQPTVCRSRDGRIWFATVNGLAAVDPSRLQFNRRPPPIVIERVLIDDRLAKTPIANKESQILEVQPGNRRVAIHYTALSFQAPESVLFKYRLDGLDTDWREGGNRRTAYYQALPAGPYRFSVIACNNDGVWNETGASIALAVLPPYWATWWFRTAAAACLSALGFLGYHRRVSQLKRERAAQEEFSRRLIESQERDRQRIAGELHDGLGQNLLLIQNRAVLGRGGAAASADAVAQFEAISGVALQAINEVRAIAYDLRPFELDRLGLTKAVESIAEKITATGLPVAHDLELIDDLLPPEYEINLYRIVQEALSNIVRHALATAVSLELRTELNQIRLTVRDDGRGFSLTAGLAAPTVSGRLGLAGMAERVKIMGGTLAIVSEPSHGTTLTIRVPMIERLHVRKN